ncbi:TPA: hypothetical protein DDW69_03455 [candidate division CPR2 bacterium]|uniref:Uncharacterized protein n=1 Tax=candidate division CPR2 bacterium GW2011_GWC1_41_48 TaxID=1618344 RepID=A0A0G0W7R6_UNCC2|nr:MAG: hypothetical protein UT47_C0003G0115 [candidate division CPR2 bacterium GW2011_GWC2_39_35]KKS09054.1 MAG: hypothetical protein UU65_C0003G0109 [candidate division CPR2 bacterium GW2011_GWC1_41_48]OGB70703.1 MAG: hypothetical protein A2Y26_02310 [candidate division CPR2 bacterium GWD2_39_7]HBG81871.1 hypothetical protein [candidate division CPR2 bacterium]HCL99956.1 hypothetical protein [candidate division CPR2 bacterium]
MESSNKTNEEMEVNKSKTHILILLKEIVDNFEFKGRLPQKFQGDESKIKTIADSFGKKIITATVVSEIIRDLAFKEVLEKVKYDDSKYKGKITLNEITEVDTTEITNKVNSILTSIPIEYHFLLRLPKCDKVLSSIAFAHNIEVLSVNSELMKPYSEKNQAKDLLSSYLNFQSGGSQIQENDLLLRVTGKGYISEYGTIQVNTIDPLYIFKVILGIYTALNILKPQDDATYARFTSEYTYGVFLSTGAHVRVLNESTEDNQYISRKQFDLTKFELTKIDKILQNKNTPFDNANKVLSNLFSKILFKDKTNKSIVRQQRAIKNGAYWYYESLKTTQDHVKAIYMTTAFDSLLAVSSQEEVKKEYKADLIASVVAKDSLEGLRIRNAVIELYSLRNEIVHGGREISSLEQYGELIENPNQLNIYYCLTILGSFLMNRIYFVNGGLSVLNKENGKESR